MPSFEDLPAAGEDKGIPKPITNWIRDTGKIRRGRLLLVILLSSSILGASVYVANKAYEVMVAGNTLFFVRSYLPIQNPIDKNEIMTIDVEQSGKTRIAQKSSIILKVTLKPNEEYRRANNLPLTLNPDENIFITFEGTICDRNDNINIGYSCVLPMALSADKKAYEMQDTRAYFIEGEYDIFLSNGTGSNTVFTNTSANFIKILPFESHRDLDIQLLASYSGVIAILVGVPSIILTILVSRWLWVGVSVEESKPKDSKPATEEHRQSESKE